MAESVRPTKKQRELLTFIEQFIAEHGYSPSYREVMTGLSYTSVATVALHINNLIKRGHLRKRDHSARSLEVVKPAGAQRTDDTDEPAETASEGKWLLKKVSGFFDEVEAAEKATDDQVNQLFVLAGAVKLLGYEHAAQEFMDRLQLLKQKTT